MLQGFFNEIVCYRLICIDKIKPEHCKVALASLYLLNQMAEDIGVLQTPSESWDSPFLNCGVNILIHKYVICHLFWQNKIKSWLLCSVEKSPDIQGSLLLWPFTLSWACWSYWEASKWAVIRFWGATITKESSVLCGASCLGISCIWCGTMTLH